jgi:hypothetical protein
VAKFAIFVIKLGAACAFNRFKQNTLKAQKRIKIIFEISIGELLPVSWTPS